MMMMRDLRYCQPRRRSPPRTTGAATTTTFCPRNQMIIVDGISPSISSRRPYSSPVVLPAPNCSSPVSILPRDFDEYHPFNSLRHWVIPRPRRDHSIPGRRRRRRRPRGVYGSKILVREASGCGIIQRYSWNHNRYRPPWHRRDGRLMPTIGGWKSTESLWNHQYFPSHPDDI